MISYLLDELDKTLALFGAIFSLILTIWLKLVIDHPLFMMIGVLCFIVCIGYLIIRPFINPSWISYLEELKCNNLIYIKLNIIFFLLLSYSIIIIYLRPYPYVRPLGYFIATILMAVLVANEILFLSSKKPQIYFALFKIIIIGLSLQYSQIVIFPNLVAIDPWIHRWFTIEILNNGHIPDIWVYSKLPLMHLMIGITSLITDLGYKLATMLSISLLQVVCNAIFIFLLGKFLISTKVGLLASLLLQLSTYHILYGYMSIPNTMASIFIIPIMFILLKFRINNCARATVIFLMGTLILTHTVTAMCLSILLFVFWLYSLVYSRLFHQEMDRSVTWSTYVLFSTMMVAYWSHISGHILTLVRFIKIGFPERIYALQYQFSNPTWELIFMYLGMFLFFSISFIGCFYILSKQFINSNRFATTIGGITILCLAFFPLIIGINILECRWIYFSQILMAIPLSLSILLINSIFKHKMIKCFLISLTIFILSFLTIMSPMTNIDNHVLSSNLGVNRALTMSELQTMETILEKWNGSIASDWFYITTIKFQSERDIRFIYLKDITDSDNFIDLQGAVTIIREEILKSPYQTEIGRYKLKYDIKILLYKQSFNRIYDCETATGYLKP